MNFRFRRVKGLAVAVFIMNLRDKDDKIVDSIVQGNTANVNGQYGPETSVYRCPLSHRYVMEGRDPQLPLFENHETCMMGLNPFCEDFNVGG
jgi:hypothetical protein